MYAVDEKLGFHTPVSNLIDDADIGVVGNIEEIGSEGSAPGIGSVNGEIEKIKGFHPPEKVAESTEVDIANLPDIAWASFGEPEESVIGVDSRVQISPASSYPWRGNASLLITAADGSLWLGTGWFLGPHTLGTAGHVVYIKNSGVSGRDGWVRSIQVVAGRDGSSMPYGVLVSSNFRAVTGWINNGDPSFDYGAIVIPTDLGRTTGWYGIKVYDTDTIKASTANVAGYPGDKPAGTQWYAASAVTAVNDRKIYYETDTFGGQSGSAVYKIENGQRYAMAIHTNGGSAANSGTRIVQAVAQNLVAWQA